MLIRNLGVDGLSLKAGRQLISMGNQRLFGTFRLEQYRILL